MSALPIDDLRMRREAAGGPSAMRPTSGPSPITERPWSGVGMGMTGVPGGSLMVRDWRDDIPGAERGLLKPVTLRVDGGVVQFPSATLAIPHAKAAAAGHDGTQHAFVLSRIRLGCILNQIEEQIGLGPMGLWLAHLALNRRTVEAARDIARHFGTPEGALDMGKVEAMARAKGYAIDVRISMRSLLTLKAEPKAVAKKQHPNENPDNLRSSASHPIDPLPDGASVVEVPYATVFTDDEACDVDAEDPFDLIGVPDSDVPDEDAEEESGDLESGEEKTGGDRRATQGPVPSPQSPVPAPARRYSAPVVQMSLGEVYERAEMMRKTVERLSRVAETSPAMAARVAELFASFEMAAMEIGGEA